MEKDLRVLLVPGGGGSDPGHWHHAWAAADARCEWVEQANWTGGTQRDWVSTLDTKIGESTAPTVLVAHSLACIVVAHWAAKQGAGPVVGALLVAPADIDDDWAEPDSLYKRFQPIPLQALPFTAIVAASTNDPLLSLARAETFATAWSASLEIVGPHLHLGADADLGTWPAGQALFDGLLVRLS